MIRKCHYKFDLNSVSTCCGRPIKKNMIATYASELVSCNVCLPIAKSREARLREYYYDYGSPSR